MGCGCQEKKIIPKTTKILESSGNFHTQNETEEVNSRMVDIEYLGEYTATFRINSRVDPTLQYRFANNNWDRVKSVLREDAQYLLGLTSGEKPLYRLVSESHVAEKQSAMTFLGAPIE